MLVDTTGLIAGLFSLVPILITSFGVLLELKDTIFSNTSQKLTNDGYDFVVVGGGSAGCVVAARLSENPKHRVLLLEAGGNPNPFAAVPLTTPFLQNHPATDWQYTTAPFSDSSGVSMKWPRGRGLGGSSTTNFMMYMRGNPLDFDQWANITGDFKWSYNNVEHYFKKMEDYHGIYKNNLGKHGRNGPLRIEPVIYAPGLDYVLEAVKEAGYTFSPLEYTQKRGRRYSTYSAYIKPNLDRPNLEILRYSHVTKIHFNHNLKANGVSFVRRGGTSYVTTKREVIICAGTINSAQLLMLSGIGPLEHLKSVGINPLVNLPVGRNLQDHVSTIIGPFMLNKPVSFMPPRDVTLISIGEFVLNGSGPLSSPLGTIGIGVTSSSSSPEWPNLLHIFASLGIYEGLGATLDQIFGTENYYTNLFSTFIEQDAHLVNLSLGKPRSTGFIELKDGNPLSKPIIYPQYYSDPGNQDIQDMIEGYQMLVNLYENTNSLGKKL
ncbi:unnamed protein product [Orchesella dallaii]|uniref:Glucose-methanol-choline oxidoreductase N-terminal domain-containing protein n=1 Tax=Orchesella dallaii TaxID=48710 RepID=A0ABP1S8G9_9HEXA